MARRKLKSKKRKTKKLVNNKYRMDDLYTGESDSEEQTIGMNDLDTGASNPQERDIETIFAEAGYVNQEESRRGGPAEVFDGEISMQEYVDRSGRRRLVLSQSERELVQLGTNARQRRQLDRLLEREESDFIDQTGIGFLTTRRREMTELAEMRKRLKDKDKRKRFEYIFRLIYNNKIYELQSLLSTDVFINKNKNKIFVDQYDDSTNDTFLTYAIKLDRLEIVRLFLNSGFEANINMINLTTNPVIINLIEIYSNNALTLEEKNNMVKSVIILEGPKRKKRRIVNLMNQEDDIARGVSEMVIEDEDDGIARGISEMVIVDIPTRTELSKMKIAGLIELCNYNNLSSVGKRKELIKRLRDFYGYN